MKKQPKNNQEAGLSLLAADFGDEDSEEDDDYVPDAKTI